MTIYETERLVVRDWTLEPDDLARVFDTYSRPEVVRFLDTPPLPLREPAGTAEAVRRWHTRNAQFGAEYGIWAVQRSRCRSAVAAKSAAPRYACGPSRSSR